MSSPIEAKPKRRRQAYSPAFERRLEAFVPFTCRFDRSGTTVRCVDGFARRRRDCRQLEDGWHYEPADVSARVT